MLYAALGDSITYGYSSSAPEHSYVSHLSREIQTNEQVNVYLHAKPGWTSTQLAKSLPKVPDVIWGEAKLTTLLVGGNDLLKVAPWILSGDNGKVLKVAENLYQNLLKIAQTVNKGNGVVLIGNLYNPFPSSLMAAEYIRRLNDAVHAVAERERLRVVDLCSLFQGNEHRFIEGFKAGELRDLKIFKNPIHPNNRGHKAIAGQFLNAYKRIGGPVRVTGKRKVQGQSMNRAKVRRGS